MSLSADQLYLLNTLPYMCEKGINTPGKEDTVRDFILDIQEGNLYASLANDFQSEKQIKETCEQILKDTELCNMIISHTSTSQDNDGADRFIITSPKTAVSKECIIVFEGTVGGLEWRDNFIAGCSTDEADHVSSSEQVRTKEWFESPEVQALLKDSNHVTVTGHSKGGNKAKYLTILDDEGQIDSCVSFDGQGFSDEFMKTYAEQISRNQDRISNYNNQNDYVSILLNDVGSVQYNKGDFCDPANNHSLFTINIPLDKNKTDHRNYLLSELDRMLNSYLRTLDDNEKRVLLPALGEIVTMLVAKEPCELEKLFNPAALVELTNFAGYLLTKGSNTLASILPHLIQLYPGFFQAAKLRSLLLYTNMPDGSDISYPSTPGVHDFSASSGTLLMDLNWLEDIIGKLIKISDEIRECAISAQHCSDQCDDEDMNFLISTRNSSSIFSVGQISTPGILLRNISKNALKLAERTNALSACMKKVLSIYEETENQLIASVRTMK